MIVKNSTQDIGQWTRDYNPTELSTESYANAIVAGSIISRVNRDVRILENIDSDQIIPGSYENENTEQADFSKVKTLYGFKDASHYSKKTQRWIGYVLTVEGNTFKSRLEDLTTPGTDEVSEFEISDISPEDRELLQRGAVFYWSIGETMSNGQLKKESIIRFKRSAPFSSRDIDRMEDRAEFILKTVSWD